MTKVKQLLGNKIGVKVIETPSKVGKIIIPEAARRLTQEAIVKLIGGEVKIDLKINDRVLYDPFIKSDRLEHNGENLLIYRVDELLGILSDG